MFSKVTSQLLLFGVCYSRTGVETVPELRPRQNMEAHGAANGVAFAPQLAREIAGGEAQVHNTADGSYERAYIQAQSDMSSRVTAAASASAEGRAGIVNRGDAATAQFSAGPHGEVSGDVRLSDTKEQEIASIGNNVETPAEAVEEWKKKRVEDKFAPIYERLSKDGGKAVLSHLEYNTRSHLTYTPAFEKFVDAGTPLLITANIEGANIPVLTAKRMVPPNFDDALFTREIQFLSACDSFLQSGSMMLEISRTAGSAAGFDAQAWEQCLNEDCASRFGSFYANVYEAGNIAQDAVESFCVIPKTDEANRHNSLTAGRCAIFNQPCECKKDVVRPELNFHTVEWKYQMTDNEDERMKFQVCLAELSSLVYKLQQEIGSDSNIQIKTSDAALFSPVPNDFKRIYAIESKLITNAFLASSVRDTILNQFKDLFHLDFYVQIEQVALKYSREDNVDEIFREDYSSKSSKSVAEEWLSQGILEANSQVVNAFREITELEHKTKKLTSGLQVEERSTETISEKVTASLRVDVAKILESLSAFLQSAISNGNMGVLSMAYYIARFHVEKMSLKYFISQIKSHKRRWMRFDKLEQDMHSKADVDDATINCWADECKVAGSIAMEKLETEMIMAFRMEQKKRGLASANAHDFSQRKTNEYTTEDTSFARVNRDGFALGNAKRNRQDQYQQEMNFDDEEMDEFIKEDTMGDFEMTLKGRKCRGPDDFAFFGVGDFDRRACSVCISEAREVILQAHRGNLDRDYESLRGFIQNLNLVKNTLKMSAVKKLQDTLMGFNDAVTLIGEGGPLGALIERVFIDPRDVEMSQSSLAIDEVYAQAIIETSNPQLVQVILDSIFMASTRYRAQDATVEIVGFFRDLKAQQCTIFVPNFFTPLVCNNKNPKSIQANGLSSPLDAHLRYSSMEWTIEQGFLDRSSADGGEADDQPSSAAKMWMLFPSNPEKSFTLDCDTIGSSEADKANFLQNLDEWSKYSPPLSPDYMTLPDVGKVESVSCDAYCGKALGQRAEGGAAKCRIERTNRGSKGTCSMFVQSISPEPVDGVETEGSALQVNDWRDADPAVSCTPAEVGCVDAPEEAGEAGTRGRQMMEFWRKTDPIRRQTNMLFGSQIANLGNGGVSQAVGETSFQLAQRPRVTSWISGMGGVTCDGISGWVNQWLLGMVDMPYDSYSFSFSATWRGSNFRRILQDIESDSNIYGAFRLNILKTIEEVMKRHFFTLYSDGKSFSDSTVRNLVTEAFLQGIKLSACEKDTFCVGIDVAKLTSLVFHADSLGVAVDLESLESISAEFEKAIAGAIAASREFVAAGLSGQVDDFQLDMKLQERFRLEDAEVRALYPEEKESYSYHIAYISTTLIAVLFAMLLM